MFTFNVFWSPEGRKIATVQARTARAAKRKAPMPYRKFPGELYVQCEHEYYDPMDCSHCNPRTGGPCKYCGTNGDHYCPNDIAID
jgi:hypothetical protein